MYKKIIASFGVLFFAFSLFVSLVSAEPILPPSNPSAVPAAYKSGAEKGCSAAGAGSNCGAYGLDDVVRIGLNVSTWILGMVGSAALLMFIWGGFQWLTSAGASGKIEAGRKIMINAVIGIVIVFASFLIVKFVVTGLLGMTWEGGYVTFKK